MTCASRRGGRVVEGARLESVYTGNRIEGSNPSPSANLQFPAVSCFLVWAKKSQYLWAFRLPLCRHVSYSLIVDGGTKWGIGKPSPFFG